MNTYSLGISGSPALAIILFLAGLALAIFTYRKTVPAISNFNRSILITLRALALALMLFAVFEPVLTIMSLSEKAPKVAVLLDNSVSAGLADGQGERKEAYKEALENAGLDALDEENLKVYLFGGETREIASASYDSVDHSAQTTNISKALRRAARAAENENIRAALLITDGAFNEGVNPIYDAEDFGRPVFAIGIGDSNRPKDVAIKSMLTNEVAYVENPSPVNVNLEVSGYDEGELKVELLNYNEKISEQIININPEKNDYSLLFEFLPDDPGIQKLIAKVSGLDEEITYRNNSSNEFINVLQNKRRFTIIAGAPSPDVSFIKNYLLTEKGAEVDVFAQLKGSMFKPQRPDMDDFYESDMIFLIGFPTRESPSDVIDMARKALASGKPCFFVYSPEVDRGKLKPLEPYLPFSILSSNKNEFYAEPNVSKDFIASPLLRIEGSAEDIEKWNSLPPLFKTETFVNPQPGAKIVMNFKAGGAALNEPLILTRNARGSKSVAALGYGFYRWKLSGYASAIARSGEQIEDLFSIFMGNSVRWLSVDDENKKVSVKTAKRIYSTNESVEFIAQIYDAAYAPIDGATVEVSISGGDGEKREIILGSIGKGRYTGSIDGLGEGDYRFVGEARLENSKLGSDDGMFVVGETALEYYDLQMNVNLLRSISERSGGKFYLPATAKSFVEDLKNTGKFKSKPIADRRENALWNLPWLLAAAILFFSLEWFIRKKLGLL